MSHEPSVSRPRPLPRRMIAVLALCGGLAPFAIDAYVPGLYQIAREFGASASVTQLSLTGFLITMGLGQLVIGPLSDQRGRRTLLLLGLVGSGIASLVSALAPSIVVLIIARCFQGVCGAAGVVLSKAIIADVGRGKGIAKALSTIMAIQSIAPVIAPAVGGVLIPWLSWRAVFVMLACVFALAALGVWWAVPETLRSEDRHTGGIAKAFANMGELLTRGSYVFPTLMFVAGFAVMFAYISASSFIMIRMNGFTEREYALMFTFNSLTLVLASAVNPRIIDRIPARRWVTIVGCTQAAGVAWIVISVTLLGAAAWPLMAGFAVVVCCNGFLLPNLVALSLEASAGRTGAGSAMLGAAQFGLAAVVAPLTGIGDGATALPMALTMVIASCVLLVALMGVRRTHPDA